MVSAVPSESGLCGGACHEVPIHYASMKNSVFRLTVWCLGGCVVALMGCGLGSPDEVADRVAVDLVNRVHAADSFSSRPFVPMGTEAVPSTFISGWSPPEPGVRSNGGFSWAISERAVVETELIDTGIRELSIRCRPFSWEEGPDQRLAVAVNGRDLGEVVLGTDFADYTFVLPADTLILGRNRVEMRFAWTERPADRVPGSTDQRKLAAVFHWLRFGTAVPADDSTSADRGDPMLRGRDLVIPSGTGLHFRIVVPQDAVDGAVKMLGSLLADPPAGFRPLQTPDRWNIDCTVAGTIGAEMFRAGDGPWRPMSEVVPVLRGLLPGEAER